jgi:hypothetical protein
LLRLKANLKYERFVIGLSSPLEQIYSRVRALSQGGEMFCPNCGAESTSGLSYCKHCGSNLADTSQPGEPGSRNVLAALILAGATVAIVLGGLAIVLNHALMLVSPEPSGNALSARDTAAIAGMMICFGSAAIVLSTLMLIKLFSRVMGFGSVSGKPARPARTPESPPRVSQIPAPPIVFPSVTEHTTRNFEPRLRRQGTSE